MKKRFLVFFLIGVLYICIQIKYNIGIPCLFYKITGLYCPGCGITRAIISLVKLEFYQAFRYNMMIVILIPFVIICSFYKYIMKGQKEIPSYIFFILLVIIMIFAILRNIPFFYYLAPIEI